MSRVAVTHYRTFTPDFYRPTAGGVVAPSAAGFPSNLCRHDGTFRNIFDVCSQGPWRREARNSLCCREQRKARQKWVRFAQLRVDLTFRDISARSDVRPRTKLHHVAKGVAPGCMGVRLSKNSRLRLRGSPRVRDRRALVREAASGETSVCSTFGRRSKREW